MEHAFTAFGKLDTAAEPKKLRVGTILGTVEKSNSDNALQVVGAKGGTRTTRSSENTRFTGI